VNNQPEPPQPPVQDENAHSNSITAWALNARNAVLAAGFAVLVLGAVADIAHFVGGHDPAGTPATVLLQPDSAGPPLAVATQAAPASEATPIATPTALPGVLLDPVFNSHTVESGDVLFDIANRYGTTTQALIELNALENPDRIEVGQVLALPNTEAN